MKMFHKFFFSARLLSVPMPIVNPFVGFFFFFADAWYTIRACSHTEVTDLMHTHLLCINVMAETSPKKKFHNMQTRHLFLYVLLINIIIVCSDENHVLTNITSEFLKVPLQHNR